VTVGDWKKSLKAAGSCQGVNEGLHRNGQILDREICEIHERILLPTASCTDSRGAPLLKPLGNPAQNGIKSFAASELLELVKDRAWLVKVTNGFNQDWRRQYARKKNLPVEV
jgi:hypothetical protein